jgi:hypothetical protein
MKRVLTLGLAALATPGLADVDASALIAEKGLTGAVAVIEAIQEPTPSDRFALGGTLFLAAIEKALQTRYRSGMSDDILMMADIPILRLPIPENFSPEPFDPAMVATVFRDVERDLGRALAALDSIGDTDEVAVTIVSVRFGRSDGVMERLLDVHHR